MPNNFDFTLEEFPQERISEFFSLLELLRRGTDLYDYSIKFVEYNGSLLLSDYYVCTNDINEFTFSWYTPPPLDVFPATVVDDKKYYGVLVGGTLDFDFSSLDELDTSITLELKNSSDSEYLNIDSTTATVYGVSVKHAPIQLIVTGNNSGYKCEIAVRVTDRYNDLKQYAYSPPALKDLFVSTGDRFVIKYFVNINGRFVRSTSHSHTVSSDEVRDNSFTFLDDTVTKIGSDLKLDQEVVQTTLNERQKSIEFFKGILDLPAFSSADHERLRRLILDWYSVHKSGITRARNATDPFSLTKEELNELIMSFGYPYPHDIATKDRKAAFLLELINFYHKKGTPYVLREVLGFYGITDAVISEWWIKKRDYDTHGTQEMIPWMYQMWFVIMGFDLLSSGITSSDLVSFFPTLGYRRDELNEFFSEIDTDGNSSINITDVISVLTTNDCIQGFYDIVQLMGFFTIDFDEIDTNEDGIITKAEVLAGNYMDEFVFDILDSNGDGMINQYELFAGLSQTSRVFFLLLIVILDQMDSIQWSYIVDIGLDIIITQELFAYIDDDNDGVIDTRQIFIYAYLNKPSWFDSFAFLNIVLSDMTEGEEEGEGWVNPILDVSWTTPGFPVAPTPGFETKTETMWLKTHGKLDPGKEYNATMRLMVGSSDVNTMVKDFIVYYCYFDTESFETVPTLLYRGGDFSVTDIITITQDFTPVEEIEYFFVIQATIDMSPFNDEPGMSIIPIDFELRETPASRGVYFVAESRPISPAVARSNTEYIRELPYEEFIHGDPYWRISENNLRVSYANSDIKLPSITSIISIEGTVGLLDVIPGLSIINKKMQETYEYWLEYELRLIGSIEGYADTENLSGMADGDRYIVSVGDRINYIGTYSTSSLGWTYTAPLEKDVAYISNTGTYHVWNGEEWINTGEEFVVAGTNALNFHGKLNSVRTGTLNRNVYLTNIEGAYSFLEIILAISYVFNYKEYMLTFPDTDGDTNPNNEYNDREYYIPVERFVSWDDIFNDNSWVNSDSTILPTVFENEKYYVVPDGFFAFGAFSNDTYSHHLMYVNDRDTLDYDIIIPIYGQKIRVNDVDYIFKGTREPCRTIYKFLTADDITNFISDTQAIDPFVDGQYYVLPDMINLFGAEFDSDDLCVYDYSNMVIVFDRPDPMDDYSPLYINITNNQLLLGPDGTHYIFNGPTVDFDGSGLFKYVNEFKTLEDLNGFTWANMNSFFESKNSYVLPTGFSMSIGGVTTDLSNYVAVRTDMFNGVGEELENTNGIKLFPPVSGTYIKNSDGYLYLYNGTTWSQTEYTAEWVEVKNVYNDAWKQLGFGNQRFIQYNGSKHSPFDREDLTVNTPRDDIDDDPERDYTGVFDEYDDLIYKRGNELRHSETYTTGGDNGSMIYRRDLYEEKLGKFTNTFDYYDTTSMFTMLKRPDIFLAAMNPTLKNAVDSFRGIKTDYDIVEDLLRDLEDYLKNSLGIMDVPIAYIILGLDFYRKLEPVIEFFKPYRARVRDFITTYKINDPVSDYAGTMDFFEVPFVPYIGDMQNNSRSGTERNKISHQTVDKGPYSSDLFYDGIETFKKLWFLKWVESNENIENALGRFRKLTELDVLGQATEECEVSLQEEIGPDHVFRESCTELDVDINVTSTVCHMNAPRYGSSVFNYGGETNTVAQILRVSVSDLEVNTPYRFELDVATPYKEQFNNIEVSSVTTTRLNTKYEVGEWAYHGSVPQRWYDHDYEDSVNGSIGRYRGDTIEFIFELQRDYDDDNETFDSYIYIILSYTDVEYEVDNTIEYISSSVPDRFLDGFKVGIIAPGIGEFEGHDGEIATFTSNGWVFESVEDDIYYTIKAMPHRGEVWYKSGNTFVEADISDYSPEGFFLNKVCLTCNRLHESDVDEIEMTRTNTSFGGNYRVDFSNAPSEILNRWRIFSDMFPNEVDDVLETPANAFYLKPFSNYNFNIKYKVKEAISAEPLNPSVGDKFIVIPHSEVDSGSWWNTNYANKIVKYQGQGRWTDYDSLPTTGSSIYVECSVSEELWEWSPYHRAWTQVKGWRPLITYTRTQVNNLKDDSEQGFYFSPDLAHYRELNANDDAVMFPSVLNTMDFCLGSTKHFSVEKGIFNLDDGRAVDRKIDDRFCVDQLIHTELTKHITLANVVDENSEPVVYYGETIPDDDTVNFLEDEYRLTFDLDNPIVSVTTGGITGSDDMGKRKLLYFLHEKTDSPMVYPGFEYDLNLEFNIITEIESWFSNYNFKVYNVNVFMTTNWDDPENMEIVEIGNYNGLLANKTFKINERILPIANSDVAADKYILAFEIFFEDADARSTADYLSIMNVSYLDVPPVIMEVSGGELDIDDKVCERNYPTLVKNIISDIDLAPRMVSTGLIEWLINNFSIFDSDDDGMIYKPNMRLLSPRFVSIMVNREEELGLNDEDKVFTQYRQFGIPDFTLDDPNWLRTKITQLKDILMESPPKDLFTALYKSIDYRGKVNPHTIDSTRKEWLKLIYYSTIFDKFDTEGNGVLTIDKLRALSSKVGSQEALMRAALHEDLNPCSSLVFVDSCPGGGMEQGRLDWLASGNSQYIDEEIIAGEPLLDRHDICDVFMVEVIDL